MNNTVKLGLASILGCLALAGCSSDDEPSAAPTPTPAPEAPATPETPEGTGGSAPITGEPTPEDHAIRNDERAFLISHVRQLPIALREVAVLLLEGFSPAEIADTLGLTPNAVSIRGLRARELLRASLESSDER